MLGAYGGLRVLGDAGLALSTLRAADVGTAQNEAREERARHCCAEPRIA